MKSKIKYGKKDILAEDEFDPKNVKVRITTFIDMDILEKLKEEAKMTGKKYQTLLNKKLRQAVLDEENIHTTLDNLNKRLSVVEKRLKAG